MSLVARHLEEAGIATVIIGSAQDIVETAGVPRFVFVDFPLGNPVGRPGRADEQRSIIERGLEMLVGAFGPRSTQRLELAWDSDEWRANFMHVGPDNLAALAAAGRARREKQAANKTAGDG